MQGFVGKAQNGFVDVGDPGEQMPHFGVESGFGFTRSLNRYDGKTQNEMGLVEQIYSVNNSFLRINTLIVMSKLRNFRA